jgi:hypothetical protein
MTKSFGLLVSLAIISLAAGCERGGRFALCPCFDGWICCGERNVCRPAGTSCAAYPAGAATPDGSTTRDGSANETPNCPPGTDCPGGTGTASVDAARAETASSCDVGRDATPLLCPGRPFAFASLGTPSATLQAIVGRWQLCEGTGFLWGPANAHRGIEFTSDGKFFLLGVDTASALQRVAGLNSTGTYVGGDIPNDLNIYFRFAEGGGAYFFPSFDQLQAHMHAGGDSGNDSDYVRVAPGDNGVPGVASGAACEKAAQ